MKPDFARLEDLDIIRALDAGDRARFMKRLTLQAVQGGEYLLRQGDPANTFHLVTSGRFAVSLGGGPPLAMIGRGEPVGEIAFFTGGVRTADVSATRDSEVLTLTRADFDALASDHPLLWRSVVTALAARLERATAAYTAVPEPAIPRTVVVASAGDGPFPTGFAVRLAASAKVLGSKVRILDDEIRRAVLGDVPLDVPETNRWLAREEAANDLLVFAARSDDGWARKAIRQADAAVLIASGNPDASNPVEALIADHLRPSDIRLVIPEGRASAWLAAREVGAHHLGDDTDSVARFLTGQARGLVLGGGGALCGAHLAVAFALHEAGARFEAFGGTSAGAAICAALAMDMPRAEIIERCKDIFLTNRSLKRWTVPRYGLVDPEVVDRMVRKHYGEGTVEDMPRPFFAMTTDLADATAHVLDRGPLWQAIRASCSIPVLLPPIIDPEGRILVDGGIVDNLPVGEMRARKRGPNVAVVLGPSKWRRASFRYSDFPDRRTLLAQAALPWRKRKRLAAPTVAQVLTRTMMLASDAETQAALSQAELVFAPPLPKGMGILDWHRFEAFERESRDWARAEIDRRLKDDPAMLDAFL